MAKKQATRKTATKKATAAKSKTNSLKVGTRVQWNTSQGQTQGKVVEKVTSSARAGGHVAKANADDPQYRVRSEKSGKSAIHKAEQLQPISGEGEQPKSEKRSTSTKRSAAASKTSRRSSQTTDDDDQTQLLKEFRELVNVTPARLKKWLETPESQEVGFSRSGSGESVGHRSGRRIIELVQRDRADYTAADWRHVRKVIGYIKRHSAQRPEGDVKDTPWRYSLLNWGHDPLKS